MSRINKKDIKLILLGIGIFGFPFLFSWVTLKKGFSKKERIVAFVWLLISLFTWIDCYYSHLNPTTFFGSKIIQQNIQPMMK